MTARVKGISFHSTLPWILVGLHSGDIQLHDYFAKVLVHVFKEHEGAVRGICFHQSQPLFTSGGDDGKVKLWNLNERRCLYTFTGHTDYIRTVQFHWVLPWILSSCDDNTARIFNWQNRTCIGIITNHQHYIMTAFFHPEEDLIVTCSLDETVKLWNYSELKKKFSASFYKKSDGPSGLSSKDIALSATFSGHLKAVNWASFHPKKSLVVSGADDFSCRICRYRDVNIWETESLSDFHGNVTCAIFHPKLDIVFCCSEDCTLKIWDYNSSEVLGIIAKERERFWVIAAHERLPYFAAGHDGGFLILKLEPQRVPFIRISENHICKMFNHEFQIDDLITGKTTVVCGIDLKKVNPLIKGYPKYFYYNTFDPGLKAFLSNRFEKDKLVFELFLLPKSSTAVKLTSQFRGEGIAVFIAKDKICCWNEKGVLLSISLSIS